MVLYFIGRIIQLYQMGDPEAVYIFENREIWVVPFINPDGYVANEKRRHLLLAKCKAMGSGKLIKTF